MNEINRLQMTSRVSLISALTNLSLAIFKIGVGIFSDSHALVADGVHSFSDLLSDALVYFAAQFGGRRPDPEHPYGHHRIETIAALIIAVLLLTVGTGIIYNSVQHVMSKTPPAVHSIPVMAIAMISILANEWLFHYTLKAGKKIHSSLLITNAWHNRSDALVSIIVLLTALGHFFEFPYLDLIGAMIIAILILKTALGMIRKGLSELIDAAVDPDTLTKIQQQIQSVTGVKDIHLLRTRLHGGHIFVDVHILVDPKISVSEGHYISDQVHKVLSQNFEEICDITVHIDPEDDEKMMPSLNSPNREDIEFRLREHWKKLAAYGKIQRILIHYLDGRLQIEVFIPAQSVSSIDPHQLLTELRETAKGINDIEKIELHLTI